MDCVLEGGEMELKEKRTELQKEADQLETTIRNAQQQVAGLQNIISQSVIRLAQVKGKLELLDELLADE